MVRFLEVTADQVGRLSADQLVELVRRLVQAEMVRNGIPLRASSVPEQINIPDGGEDGRVWWEGGPNQTDFLPSRYTIFQIKRGDRGPSGAKKETWKKGTGTESRPAELNEALSAALERSGSYIYVTGDPVVGTKVDKRVSAIREGIQETGSDPTRLHSVEIYDSNRLAAWANVNSSVALWLNEILREVDLHGFHPFLSWERSHAADLDYVSPEETRFAIVGKLSTQLKRDIELEGATQNLEQVGAALSHHFDAGGLTAKVFGPSGYGKSRFVFELIKRSPVGAVSFLNQNDVVYANFTDVKDRLNSICTEIVRSGSRCLLVVDDCPDGVLNRLREIVQGSNCRVLATDVETQSHDAQANLVVELKPASDETISGIAAAHLGDSRSRDIDYVRDVAQGFPRMAIVASEAAQLGHTELSSVDSLVQRIVWGDKEPETLGVRTLGLLSLFSVVGVERDAKSELEQLAAFDERSYRDLFRDMNQFVARGVASRLGDYVEVQPVPLAARLANQWIESSPDGTLLELFRSVNDRMKLGMLKRLRWLSWSPKVSALTKTILEEVVPDEAALNTPLGSEFLNRAVHLHPDIAMDHLHNLLGSKSIEELQEFSEGRRNVIWALESLVFRRESFSRAAELLLKLAAAENESWGNNATGQFVGLFQLYLSGTEAAPEARLRILDSGLASGNDSMRRICADALGQMLTTHHFSRTGGAERIGADTPLSDWEPQTNQEIANFYLSAIERLETIACDSNDELSEVALSNLGGHLRGLFNFGAIIEQLSASVRRVNAKRGPWRQGAKSINQWLYFDAAKAPAEYVTDLRNLYDELIPSDPVDFVLMFTEGWSTDFNDPDCRYKESDQDYKYVERMIAAKIEEIGGEFQAFAGLIDEFLKADYNMSGYAVSEIARHVSDPEELVKAIDAAAVSYDQLQRGAYLLRTALLGIKERDPSIAAKCLSEILKLERYKSFTIDLIAAFEIDDASLDRIIDLVKSDAVKPRTVGRLSLGKALQNVSPSKLTELTDALCDKGPPSIWEAMELIYFSFKNGSLDDAACALVERVCTHEAIFNVEERGHLDAYRWARLCDRLLESRSFDAATCGRVVKTAMSLLNTKDFSIQLEMDDEARSLLRKVLMEHPQLVWEAFLNACDDDSGTMSFRLQNLLGPNKSEPWLPGILNDVPAKITEAWLQESRRERIQALLSWTRLFAKGPVSEGQWCPDFIRFIERYVEDPGDLMPVASRLRTGMSRGPYYNKLERERERLIALEGVKNVHVETWRRQEIKRLEQMISDGRRDDGNRSASDRG